VFYRRYAWSAIFLGLGVTLLKRGWVSEKLRSFKWYCRWVNDGDQLVSTLRDVRDRIRRPMQEATRRDILMLQRKSLRGVSDHRVADVQESLPTYMARE